MSQDPFYSPFAAPNYINGAVDPFLLSAQASASYGMQYQPMANNQLSSNLGYNIPGMGGFGQIGSMLMSQMMAANGYTFTSMFGGANSSVMRNRYEMQQMQMASMAAMQRVGGSVLQQRMTNMGINLALQSGANQADANAYGQQWGAVASSMLNNPAAMTALNIAGSALGTDIVGLVAPEAGIAQGLYRAGMTSYMGSGVFGVSAENAATMTGRLADYFYPGGSGDPTRLRGFNGRQIGDIAVSLQQAGVLGSYQTDPTKLTGTARDIYQSELERTGDRSGALASANSESIKGRLKEATRIFQIAKEITGSDDVNQMMQAIQTLTGGGMSSMSSASIENQLSRIQEIARVARISMDQMAFIAQQGAKMAESVGLSSVVGANAAVGMVERATITYAASNRELNGQATPYNLTQNQQIDADARQLHSALASPMVQRLGAFTGVLAQAELTNPGVVSKRIEELKARRAAGGKLSAQEEQALTTLDRLQRIQSHDYTNNDYNALSGEQGTSNLGSALATLTGLSEGEARRRVSQSRVDTELGMRVNGEWILDYTTGAGNAFDIRRRLEGALRGSTELSKLNLSADRQRDLVSALADLSTTYQVGGNRTRDRVAEIQKQFGLSDQQMASLYSFSEGQLEYVTGYDLGTLAALKARGEGRVDIDKYRKALEQGMASNQALRDLGGTDIVNRLYDVVGGKISVAEALGGVKDEKLRQALADPLERYSQASLRLNNVMSTTERDAATKQRDTAYAAWEAAKQKLKDTDDGITGLTADERKKLEADKDAAQAAYKKANEFLTSHSVLTEKEIEELSRQKQKADQDLLGLLKGDRPTVGTPTAVTDVSNPQTPPPKASGEAMAAGGRPSRIEGQLNIMLNDTPLGRGMLEAAERNQPSAIVPLNQNIG